MRKILSSLLLTSALAVPAVHAQELNCKVEVTAPQVTGTNTSAIETLQAAISDYMNTTAFTKTQFAANEKIDCRLFMTIKEIDGEKMVGDLQVQSTRPVYNTSYTTTLINFKDGKVEFNYQEGQPLVFNTTAMESQLTAILNFYAYLILAVDFDSFAPQGGEPFYDQLKIIVQQAQSSGESGWKAFEDTKNRSAVLSALTDQQTAGVRQLLYDYHRRGLDEMAMSPDKGRAKISESLEQLRKVFDVAPMSVALSMFKDAKLDELVSLYSKAGEEERQKAYTLLQALYPSETQRLEKIRKPDENK